MLCTKNLTVSMISFFSITCRKWVNLAKSLCSPKDIKNFGLVKMDEEINKLEDLISEDYQEIGFCHNDLQYGNIMINEDTRAITIIVCSLFIFLYLY